MADEYIPNTWIIGAFTLAIGMKWSRLMKKILTGPARAGCFQAGDGFAIGQLMIWKLRPLKLYIY